MKKKIATIIIFAALMAISGCAANDNEDGKKDNGDTDYINYFGGDGKLKAYDEDNRWQILYDESKKYIEIPNVGLCCIDGEEVYSVCTDASCDHKKDECIASNKRKYFEINEKLYVASNNISECDSSAIVYDNKIPDEYKDDQSYNNVIEEVHVFDEKYILLREYGYCMVLDSAFKEIVHFNDLSTCIWFSIRDDYVYYLSDFCTIERVSLKDKQREKVDTGIKYILRARDDEKYFYLVDKYFKLYRVDKTTNEQKELAENIADFALSDKYIYYSDRNDFNNQCIIDIDGNKVKNYDRNKELGESVDFGIASVADGKLYMYDFQGDSKFLIEMLADGSKVHKYEIRS